MSYEMLRLILAIVSTVLLLFLLNGTLGYCSIREMGNFGSKQRPEAPSTSSAITSELDELQLTAIVSRMSSDRLLRGGLTKEYSQNALLTEGFAIDGPWRSSNGSFVEIHCRSKEYHLKRDTNGCIQRASDTTTIVRIESHTSLLGQSRLDFQVRVVGDPTGENDGYLAVGPMRSLYKFDGFPWVFRPLRVNLEPAEAAVAIMSDIDGVAGVPSRSNHPAMSKLDGDTRAQAQRFFRGLIEVLVVRHDLRGLRVTLPSQHNPGNDAIGELFTLPDVGERPISSKLILIRMINGVDLGGVINFATLSVFAWCVLCFVGRDRATPPTALNATVGPALSLLPMLGFFGTLYGMIRGFMTGQVGQGGSSELLSFIGTSLDTTILGLVASMVVVVLLYIERQRPAAIHDWMWKLWNPRP